MLKTLWLASWYPSEASIQNGDFIQRHARAAASYAQVYLLHVVAFNERKTIVHQQPNLTEEIVYYKKRGNHIFSRSWSLLQYIYLYKKYIRKYIEANGLPDIVNVQVSMRAGILALWMKKKYGVPYVITEHWTVYTAERSDNFSTRAILFRYFARKIFEHSSLSMPVSTTLGRSICDMVAQVPFVKIPNVVDTSIFCYQQGKQDSKVFTFSHVSSLENLKNPRGILRTFEAFLEADENVQLKMVGENCSPLIDYAKELRLPEDKIVFTGILPYESVAEEMQKAHAFILFSYSENLPCVIAESLCCGVPVIATQVGGVPELLNGSNGLFIPAGDELALLNAMKKIKENYSFYDREKIARDAAEKYNYATVGRQIVDVYEQVLSHK